MANFRKWLEGEKDPFNETIEPYPVKEIEEEKTMISSKRVKKALQISIRFSLIIYFILALVSFILYIGLLIYSVSYLPAVGNKSNPAFNFVATSYILRSLTDTKAVNAVTGMILDYRAFDTLGESFVLFSAVTCAFILLKEFKEKEVPTTFTISEDPILRHVAQIVIPIVFIFGIYVILNGHLSPGGGFSGGAIIGAGLILYSLAFGIDQTHRFFTEKTFKVISSIALLGYCVTKAYSFYLSDLITHESFFEQFPIGSILSGGFILILNICVGLVVSCTMYGFYCLFKRGEI